MENKLKFSLIFESNLFLLQCYDISHCQCESLRKLKNVWFTSNIKPLLAFFILL